MKNIPLPTKVEIKKSKENKNQASIIIEPCYPGYGTTLGNALRRVLLSSLPGAAVIAVKIKGAHHEFSTIPYVKEDIVDILLNLKLLCLKMTGGDEEMAALSLKVKGGKKVTAKDIKTVTGVEITNPDLEIATLTDKKAELEMKIWVKPGRGYVLIEEHEKMDLEIDAITIDSIFTPVLNVALKVENVRVGKKTNFDKLILDVETDGSITPRDAVNEAIKILIDQFDFILKIRAKEKGKIETKKQESKKTKKQKKTKKAVKTTKKKK